MGVHYDCLSLCLQHSLHLQLDISIELAERKIKGHIQLIKTSSQPHSKHQDHQVRATAFDLVN